MRADVKPHPRERGIRVGQRTPSVIQRFADTPRRKDDVGLIVFLPDLDVGLPEATIGGGIKNKKGKDISHLATGYCPSSRTLVCQIGVGNGQHRDPTQNVNEVYDCLHRQSDDLRQRSNEIGYNQLE